MNRKPLIERWKTPEGRSLEQEAIQWLGGLSDLMPRGFGIHEGGRDLRGLTVPSPTRLGKVTAGGVDGVTISGFMHLKGVHWQGLDLSHARLPSFRFSDSVIEDCRFDAAYCRDWRLWRTQVRDSSFVGCDLRDSDIGTEQNVWRGVVFDRADLRGAVIDGCLLADCSFRDVRLTGVDFDQVTMRGTVSSLER